MKKSEVKEINSKIIDNYVNAINSIREPMNEIKDKISSIQDYEEPYKNIVIMKNILDKIINESPNTKMQVFNDFIEKILLSNNGIITTRMIEPLDISREYLCLMEKNNFLEKVSRGIYISPSILEDSYYTFQQKYKKAIFSHMNALYFYGMTEEFPYKFTITVPKSYHVGKVNEQCNIFYVSDDIYELGVVEVETPFGNKVRAYDKERCICDIIRSKKRMDPEQVKKSIKQYVRSKDIDLVKLSNYAQKMGIKKRVMEIVGVFYD